MATIGYLVTTHSKVPGDIKLRRSDWGEGPWFAPYFLTAKDASWYGVVSWSHRASYFSDDVMSIMGDKWELWQEPKKKKKIAPYLMRRNDGRIFMTSAFHETEAGAMEDWDKDHFTIIRRIQELEVEVEE
jgi:hypothetical protein